MSLSRKNILSRILKNRDGVHIHDESELREFDEGQVVGRIGKLEDITEIKKLQEKIDLKQREIIKMQKKFEIIVEGSSDVYEIIDIDGTIKYTSSAVGRVIGYKQEERIGKNVFEFHIGEELKELKRMLKFVISQPDKKVKGNIIFKTKDGENIYLEVIMQNLLHEPVIEGIAINFRDISERIESEKQMAHINTHDRQTGLPNDRYCSKKLRLQCQYARENKTTFALMMLDIDGLKYVKYSLGYEMGNLLIIEIVERLREYLGEGTFISRYSEDHFAIIIQGLRKLGDYETIATGIIDLFNSSYKVHDYELNINANIGICAFPKDGNDMESLSKHAKVALLRARQEGKNIYKFYSSDLNIQNYKEFVLRSDLHNAIEKEQLFINYQPMINLKNNEILGVEALLRWEHPDWGTVNPEEFIHLAEETGLIIPIGKWVLRQVSKDYKDWLKEGLPGIKVSVNFSGIQFLEKNFTKNIKDIIDEFQLDPSFIIIEIIESVFIKNTDKIVNDLEILQSYGIQIAIDDFGTGFSALSYLNAFNIDILKLDGSFIKNIFSDDINKSIVKLIINLAKELKIKLVVEGIENREQLSFLKDLNCYTGQGYIFSKPVPVNKFKEMLAKKRCRPVLFSGVSTSPREERRKLFRIKFFQLLEGGLTILELRGRKVNVGNTKVLIKDIGPGGLCFIANVKFPVKKDIALQFTINLLDKEIKVYGYLVWTEEIDCNLQKYGVKFTIDENERMDLIRILNEVQIKMRKNALFAEGSFISGTYAQYFNAEN